MDVPLDSIQQGDCVAGMNALPAGSVDLAFADPPFNIGYDYDEYHDRVAADDYLAWSREWISAVHRALADDGTFWLAIGDEYAAELKVAAQTIGFHTRSWVVWYYTFGVNCKRKFSRSHAHLFHFVKNAENFVFRHEDPVNRIPSARELVYGDARANPLGRLPDDTWVLRPQDLADCFRPDEDTWYFPRVAGTFKERQGFHGCQMPEQLLGRIIRACSRDGAVVLDPFAGSATTLAVAKKLGRRYLGFELSREYATRGQTRLAEVRVGDPLDGSAEPTKSAPATPGGNGALGRRNGSTKRAKLSAATNGLVTAADDNGEASVAIESAAVRTLVEAFQATCDGHSVDRVVADPELDQAFVSECRRRGVPGEARSWNLLLFRLRKAGRLSHVPSTKRTELSWSDCDRYLFASEIALATMLGDGHDSLDEILCDPAAAAEFDARAAAYAPNHSPIEYRWGALKLRKEAKAARARSAILSPRRLDKFRPVDKLSDDDFPTTSGVYLVAAGDDARRLYVGETLDLRDRFRAQFGKKSRLRHWLKQHACDRLSIAIWPIEGDAADLLAYQSWYVAKLAPPLNYRDLGTMPRARRELTLTK